MPGVQRKRAGWRLHQGCNRAMEQADETVGERQRFSGSVRCIAWFSKHGGNDG